MENYYNRMNYDIIDILISLSDLPKFINSIPILDFFLINLKK